MGHGDQNINYSLRLEKNIERKMILDTLKEICHKQKSNEYFYVGFGGLFYYDFRFFHKELSIDRWFSIENDELTYNRCKLSKPYKSIKLIHGNSNDALTKLTWNGKFICWLDYTDGLSAYMLDDIDTLTTNARSGSVLVISLNGQWDYDKKKLREEFGIYLNGDNFIKADFTPSKFYSTIREIFLNKIIDILNDLNASVSDKEKLIFDPFFSFKYRDGSPMYTFGGMFYTNAESDYFKSLSFNTREYIIREDDVYKIEFPVLTQVEINLIKQQLPTKRVKSIINKKKFSSIPERHIKNYCKLYKYYPSYVEIMD